MLGGHLRHYSVDYIYVEKTTFIRRFFKTIISCTKTTFIDNNGVSPIHDTKHNQHNLPARVVPVLSFSINNLSFQFFFRSRFDSDPREYLRHFSAFHFPIFSRYGSIPPNSSDSLVVRFQLSTRFALNFFLYRHAN